MKLLSCQIFLILIIGTLSQQRVVFPNRDPRNRGRSQCAPDSTCMAYSMCPSSRRQLNGPRCLYNNWTRSNGVCCRNEVRTQPANPWRPELLETAPSNVNTIDGFGGFQVPNRESRTRFRPTPSTTEQCPRGTRCMAWNACPLSMRPRETTECYSRSNRRRPTGVCCVNTRIRPRPLTPDIPNPVPIPPNPTTTTTTTITMAPPRNPSGEECGKSLALSGLMIGGSPAAQGVWPWMVAISNRNGIPECTGSLIDRTHVLTAAHCFVESANRPIDTTQYQLRIGNVDQRLGDRYTISNLAIPNSYQYGRYYYDVAVITLDRPVSSPDYMPICLPDINFRNYTGRGVSLAGWGLTRIGGSTSDILMQLTGVPIVSIYRCNAIYGNGIRGFNSQFPSGINTGFICAGFIDDRSGRDSCSGDSGGPMMASENGYWFEIGILSFGHMRCGEAGFPAVYTRVSSVIDFIRSNL